MLSKLTYSDNGPGQVPTRDELVQRVCDYQDALAAEKTTKAERALSLVCDGVSRLIWQRAGRVAGKSSRGTVDREDLYQAGMLAVIRSAKGFDRDAGWAFTTYAALAADRAMKKARAAGREGFYLNDETDAVDRGVDAVRRDLEEQLDRPASFEEIADAVRAAAAEREVKGKQTMSRLVDITPEQIAALPSSTGTILSLDYPYATNEGDDTSFGENLQDLDMFDPAELIANEDLAAQVRSAVSRLPEDEAKAVALRTGLETGYPMRWKEVSAHLGVPERSLHNQWRKVAAKLREELSSVAADAGLVSA